MTVFSKGLQLMWGQTGMSYNIEASGTVHHQFRAFRLEELRFARGSQRPRITNKRRCVQVAVHLAAKVRLIMLQVALYSQGASTKCLSLALPVSMESMLGSHFGKVWMKCFVGELGMQRVGAVAAGFPPIEGV